MGCKRSKVQILSPRQRETPGEIQGSFDLSSRRSGSSVEPDDVNGCVGQVLLLNLTTRIVANESLDIKRLLASG